MNWFGLFRKSPAQNRAAGESPTAVPPSDVAAHPAPLPSEPPSPDQLRRQLFDAVACGDEGRLESLCEEHQDLILAHAAGWLEVPASFRSNPEAYEWYGNGLRAIARFCAERLGRHELLERLNLPASAATQPH